MAPLMPLSAAGNNLQITNPSQDTPNSYHPTLQTALPPDQRMARSVRAHWYFPVFVTIIQVPSSKQVSGCLVPAHLLCSVCFQDVTCPSTQQLWPVRVVLSVDTEWSTLTNHRQITRREWKPNRSPMNELFIVLNSILCAGQFLEISYISDVTGVD